MTEPRRRAAGVHSVESEEPGGGQAEADQVGRLKEVRQ